MIGVFQQARRLALGRGSGAMLCIVLAIGLACAATQPAEANPRYAAIVYDVNGDQVLFSRNADAQRYPASITKVMTLYLLFEELEAGRVSLDTPMRVSQLAADQVPSKVGLRPGSTISVRDAIGVLVTRSANDASVVVAEHVSGSVGAFAERMTRTARSIGMRNTTFRNPHGLPNAQQVTTARDIVTLALAIQRRFPQYYRFFNMRSYTYAGVTYRNHNRLLGQMAGVDGLKTGFIRASGFNLVANLRRDDRHLVGVVMGGRTGASRDAHMREILANALPRAQRGPGLHLVGAPLPRPRPRPQFALSPAAQVAASILVPSTVVPATLVRAGPARSAAARTAEAPVHTSALPEGTLGTLSFAAEEAGSAEAAEIEEAVSPARGGEWAIQVGAFNSEELAQRMLERAQTNVSDVLEGTAPFTETVQLNGNTLWRARFAGFERNEAEAACAALQRADFGCFPIRP